MDKNVNISCAEHLLICIRELFREKVDEVDVNDNYEFKVPVDSIIEMVKEEFGYYLPYLILKRSKRIKKVKFKRLLGEKYRIQDTLTLKTTGYL